MNIRQVFPSAVVRHRESRSHIPNEIIIEVIKYLDPDTKDGLKTFKSLFTVSKAISHLALCERYRYLTLPSTLESSQSMTAYLTSHTDIARSVKSISCNHSSMLPKRFSSSHCVSSSRPKDRTSPPQCHLKSPDRLSMKEIRTAIKVAASDYNTALLKLLHCCRANLQSFEINDARRNLQYKLAIDFLGRMYQKYKSDFYTVPNRHPRGDGGEYIIYCYFRSYIQENFTLAVTGAIEGLAFPCLRKLAINDSILVDNLIGLLRHPQREARKALHSCEEKLTKTLSGLKAIQFTIGGMAVQRTNADEPFQLPATHQQKIISIEQYTTLQQFRIITERADFEDWIRTIHFVPPNRPMEKLKELIIVNSPCSGLQNLFKTLTRLSSLTLDNITLFRELWGCVFDATLYLPLRLLRIKDARYSTLLECPSCSTNHRYCLCGRQEMDVEAAYRLAKAYATRNTDQP